MLDVWRDPKFVISVHGPRIRYVKLRVAHAPGMPGTLAITTSITSRASRVIRNSSSLRMDLVSDTWNCELRRHASGMPGTFSPQPHVSDHDMHHVTCVTNVPWCISGLLWSRRRGKRSQHSRSMQNPQFNVSGKRTMQMSKYLGRISTSRYSSD